MHSIALVIKLRPRQTGATVSFSQESILRNFVQACIEIVILMKKIHHMCKSIDNNLLQCDKITSETAIHLQSMIQSQSVMVYLQLS